MTTTTSRTDRTMMAGTKRIAVMGTLVVAGALAGAGGAVAQQGPWEPQIPEGTGTYPTGTVLVQGLDSIWTAAGEVLTGADILIVDGVIRGVGPGLSAPEGARVIDGRGMNAIPGIVDEHSHIAMSATNEFTAPMVPEVRVIDALDPDDFGIYRALSGGVTTARIMHGSSNPIGGQSAVIKTRWGMEATHDLLLPGAPRFVKFALGENVTRKGGGFNQNSRFPHSRQGVDAIYRQAFTQARAYADVWERYRANPRGFQVPPRRDLRMDALVDIMQGRIRIHAHSYRSDEILMLMRIAEEFDFKIDVFTHVLEGYRVAAEMAQHGAAASTFTDWWQYKLEAYDAIPHNAAILHEQGVLTGINTDIPWLQSFMVGEIAKPVRYGGVSKEDALRMFTLNPARMMHIDDKVGSLEVGKQGDVVLLSGSPFNSFTRVEKTIVDGIVYYDLAAEQETRGEKIITQDGAIAPQASDRPMTQAADATAVSTGPAARAAASGPSAGSLAVQESVVALVGATVHPISRASIPDGVVLLRGGVIEAVGSRTQVEIPADARRIDVQGRHVYPGLIDAVSPLGLLNFGAVGQATDLLEVGRYNPHVRAIAAVMPHYPDMKVARMNGITAAGVAQSTGVIQGTMGIVALNDQDTFERVAIEMGGPLVVDFPAPRTGADDAEPALEGERMEELVEVFERARTYVNAPSTSDDPTAGFEANVWGGDKVFLDAMVPALTGAVPVFFRATTDWQIRHVFLFAERFPEIRPVVLGGTQAFRVADELAERDIPVILSIEAAFRPTPDRDDSITASFRNAGLLVAAGVQVGFASDQGNGGDGLARNLPFVAAWSVAFGLMEEDALRALTLNNARILGLGERMGSLDTGKRADLIVTDGSPLQMLTTIERMFVGGVEVDPADNKHTRLYEAFRTRR
jgi:imidazolonepropionase-like amidohydrolase